MRLKKVKKGESGKPRNVLAQGLLRGRLETEEVRGVRRVGEEEGGSNTLGETKRASWFLEDCAIEK